MILPISLTLAGAVAVLHIWLGARVSRLRAAYKVSVGDGGHDALLRRMRAHANFSETSPVVLVLVALIELSGGNPMILEGLAFAYVLARLLHGFGMDGGKLHILRAIGMVLSTAVLVGLAGWALTTAYRDAIPQAPTETHMSTGRSA